MNCSYWPIHRATKLVGSCGKANQLVGLTLFLPQNPLCLGTLKNIWTQKIFCSLLLKLRSNYHMCYFDLICRLNTSLFVFRRKCQVCEQILSDDHFVVFLTGDYKCPVSELEIAVCHLPFSEQNVNTWLTTKLRVESLILAITIECQFVVPISSPSTKDSFVLGTRVCTYILGT